MMRLIFIAVFAISIMDVFGQALSINDARTDYDEFISSTKQLHPNPYQYITEQEFDDFASTYRAHIDSNITEQALHVLIRKMIAHMGCGHIYARPSNGWYARQREKVQSLPIRVLINDDRVYINSISDTATSIVIGDEIISINGISMSTILSEMRSIQERDGRHHTFVSTKIERLFSTYFLFLYGPFDVFEIEFIREGTQRTQKLSAGYKPKANLSFEPSAAWEQHFEIEDARFYSDLADSTALLRLDGFHRKKYKGFYKDVFKFLEQEQIERLVIDLRGNGGGNFQHGMHLLRYLLAEPIRFDFYKRKAQHQPSENVRMDVPSAITKRVFNTMPDHNKVDSNRNYRLIKKPKRRYNFDGQVIVFIDGGSFSMSAYVASQLTTRENTLLLGEPTGGGMAGSNAILNYQLTLPNSGIYVSIPHYHLNHFVGENTGGVPVNKAVVPTIEQRMRGEDALMNYLLNLK